MPITASPAPAWCSSASGGLATIERLLDAALVGRGPLAVVEGAAGVGKTTLLEAAAALAERGESSSSARRAESMSACIYELYERRDRPELEIGNYVEQAMQPAKEGTPVERHCGERFRRRPRGARRPLRSWPSTKSKMPRG